MQNCRNLNVLDYLKLRVDSEGRILYADSKFQEVTGYNVGDLILEPVSMIFNDDAKEIIFEIFFRKLLQNDTIFLVGQLKAKDGTCSWALIRVTAYTDEKNNKKYLFEIKMLPLSSVPDVDYLFSKLIEIKKNAGLEYAVKYFEGYLEEQGVDINNYIFKLLDTSPKKLNKYFEIKG